VTMTATAITKSALRTSQSLGRLGDAMRQGERQLGAPGTAERAVPERSGEHPLVLFQILEHLTGAPDHGLERVLGHVHRQLYPVAKHLINAL